jgi:hypothetical protein
MSEFDATTLAKLEAFAAIRAKQVAEIVAVFWPSPTGTIYYATRQLDQFDSAPPVSPIHARLIPEDLESDQLFQTVTSDSALSDEEVELNFWDGDGAIADLAHLHGEGVRVEVFYWLPQVELLLSHWWGHLRTPDGADSEVFTCPAAIGFRSPLLPLPRRAFFDTCQAIWGGHLSTLEQIADNDCPWNLHLPGGTIGVPGSELLPPCPRTSRTVCAQYIQIAPAAPDSKSYLGFETPVQTTPIGNQGTTMFYSSRGNTSNLKNPLRVIFGRRVVRALDLLLFTPTINTNHPEQGFVQVLFAVCEGPIAAMFNCKVNNLLIAAMHLNIRLGERRQSPTSYSSTVPNFSGTAHFYANYGQVNAAQYGANNLAGETIVDGLNDIRVYSTPTAFTRQFTNNRAWCLFEMLRNKRWGYGEADSRFVTQDWIDLAAWCIETVIFEAPDEGGTYSGVRTTFNAELIGRTTQQQISDTCAAGRFSLPFLHQGKHRIVPLKKEVLTGCKLFTDYGNDRNIVVDERGKSSIRRSQTSDEEMPNEITLTFEDAARNNIERPLTFSDTDYQLKSGQAGGDDSRRVVRKPYSAMGVTSINEAVRLGYWLLNLGEFESGGLRNNLSITFTTWFAECLQLHPYKVIKVLSRQLERYGFQYFRIRSMRKLPNLRIEITAQAYADEYYDELETSVVPSFGDYEAEAPGNTLTGGATVTVDTSCSGGAKVTGIGNGGALRFNGITVDSTRLYEATVYYKSSEPLTTYVSVNGAAAQPRFFPSSGGVVGQINIQLGILNAAGSHTIKLSNPDDICPDLDVITVQTVFLDPPELGGGVCQAEFGTIEYGQGELRIPVLPCA